jgi:hypothetical protein
MPKPFSEQAKSILSDKTLEPWHKEILLKKLREELDRAEAAPAQEPFVQGLTGAQYSGGVTAAAPSASPANEPKPVSDSFLKHLLFKEEQLDRLTPEPAAAEQAGQESDTAPAQTPEEIYNRRRQAIMDDSGYTRQQKRALLEKLDEQYGMDSEYAPPEKEEEQIPLGLSGKDAAALRDIQDDDRLTDRQKQTRLNRYGDKAADTLRYQRYRQLLRETEDDESLNPTQKRLKISQLNERYSPAMSSAPELTAGDVSFIRDEGGSYGGWIDAGKRAELIKISKNRKITGRDLTGLGIDTDNPDKDAAWLNQDIYGRQSYTGAQPLAPTSNGEDTASRDKLLNQVKDEIRQYLRELADLAATGQYSAAKRDEILSKYAGLSRVMQLGEDDPDMQFYAEALKPYGYDPIKGFSGLEEAVRRAGEMIYTTQRNAQDILQSFDKLIDKKLRDDPDTAAQYIKDNARIIRMAGLDPDEVAREVEGQVPVYKAQTDPSVPLSWLADDETGGYISNFIISKSSDGLPDGNFVIAKTYGPNMVMPFDVPGSFEGGHRVYYTLMFITKDGEVKKMGDRELTLQVTGTLGYAQYLASLYKRQMQEGKPYQLIYNAKTLEEYLQTLPEDKRNLERFLNSGVALTKFFDINPLQKTMEVLSIPKTIYMNAQIALARAIGGRKQGWVENAGFSDYSREASQTYGGADIAAQLKDAGFLGETALAGLDMMSDPLFWLGTGAMLKAGFAAKAATVPGSLEESNFLLGLGERAAPYEKLPDEAFGMYNEGVEDIIDGFKIIDGKVGGKIPVDEFKTIRQSSIKNPDADSITFGKYSNGPDSYTVKAGKTSSYFDMGEEWNAVRKRYNLSYDEMFEYFNKPAIKDALDMGKKIQFSHNPINDDGFLGMEWDYIKDIMYLTDDDLIEMGGMWYVK